MRKGGGKDKGANHEREIGRKLSLWLSKGERVDLFTRNVLSGGSYTRQGTGIPGDLAASHPLAYAFLLLFEVEAKHWHEIEADKILWTGKGELLKVIDKLEDQATSANRFYMLIARQNYRPDLLMLPYLVGSKCSDPLLIHHALWSNRIYACRLDDFTKQDPDEFTKKVNQLISIQKAISNRSNR